MVVPFLPPHLSFSSTPSSSSSQTLPFANAQVLTTARCPPLFAASTSHRDATVQAVLLFPGTTSLRFSDHCSLSLSSWSASSGSRSPGMTRPQKRLCKAQEAFNSRSRILCPDGIANFDSTHSFDADFRVLAFKSHGSSELAVAELERPADDVLNVQHLYRKADKSAPRRLKTAEELHFEAIQDYHLRYEEVGYVNVNDESYGVVPPGPSSPEPPRSPMRVRAPVGSVDGVNTPVDESEYMGVCEGVPPYHGDENASYSLAIGFEAELPNIWNIEKQVSSNVLADGSIPSEALQFPLQTDEKNAERKKCTQAVTAKVDSSKSSTRRAPPSSEFTSPQFSSITISKSKSAKTRDLNSSQNHHRSENERHMQNESPPSMDESSQTEEENTKSEVNGDLTEDQKIRMELNKAAALARRNMRTCEEAVLEAQAKGLSFPKFESLLVDKSWGKVLRIEFQKPYMERLHQFVSQEAAGRIPIYPPPAKLFNAFNSCPFDKVKVVVIGQDPYHGPGQAMGLCFSVEKAIKLPSSLSNIFLELESDLYCDFPSHGNLEKWAHQGVLLLNTVLTVRDHHANSHAKKGWELFTDAAIRALAQQRSDIVFLLWGNQAQEKLRLINKTSHHILKAFHPSGISAHRGFFKCRHFSKCNQILVDQGSLPIDWQL